MADVLTEPNETGVEATPYDASFFDSITTISLESAAACVPDIVRLLAPRSVADVGCGRGAFLKLFADHGVTDVVGMDGDYVDRSSLLIPSSKFRPTDLRSDFRAGHDFDLAVSLEVAEHLPDTSADGFVKALARLAPVIWFSAAIPVQGGTDHINEQWPDYWSDKFQAQGYLVYDILRPLWLNNPSIAWWYSQNSLLYVHPGRISLQVAEKLARYVPVSKAPRLVHQRMFERHL